jgi:hypothetical protein
MTIHDEQAGIGGSVRSLSAVAQTVESLNAQARCFVRPESTCI